MTDTSMKHDKHDASKQKAGIMIRIFRVCPISPTNGQKSEGKTRLHHEGAQLTTGKSLQTRHPKLELGKRTHIYKFYSTV
jgi:hypothetical protein